jgi:ribosome maturation factor RimP
VTESKSRAAGRPAGGSSIKDDALVRLAEGVAASLGLRLYDLVIRRSGPRWKLQVFVEGPDRPVTLDDCEKVSRQLSRELDVLDPIANPYDLEVSSPGIERALRVPWHWQAVRGERAFVRFRQADGSTRAMVAEIVEADERAARLRAADGTEFEVGYDAVTAARKHADWD